MYRESFWASLICDKIAPTNVLHCSLCSLWCTHAVFGELQLCYNTTCYYTAEYAVFALVWILERAAEAAAWEMQQKIGRAQALLVTRGSWLRWCWEW